MATFNSATLVGLLIVVALLFRMERRVIAALSAARATRVSFSAVSQTEAEELLYGTQLNLVVGEPEELLAARDRRAVVLQPFTWDVRAGEAAGTPSALKHLQESLRRLGVTFGPGGYDLLDVHSRNTSLSFNVGDKVFTGGVDGVIVPHNIAPLSAIRNARAVIELKMPKRGGAPLGDTAIGQCLAELIGVSSRAVHPCLLLLTDGATCDVLRLRGSLVKRWAGVPLTDALHYVARVLKHESSAALEFADKDAEQLEPQTARTLWRLRQQCKPPGALPGLMAQLDSLAAAEGLDVDDTENGCARRVTLATELVSTWRHALEPDELPQHVQHLFA